MLKTIEGIIISNTDYGETSKIVNILTENGIIGCIAKGAKSLKSPLRSFTLKLTYGSFNIYYKEKTLSIIKSVDVINNFNNIKTDLNRISYFTYIVDLASQIMKQNNDVDIYQLLISSIHKINNGLDPQIITNIFELKMLDYLGVGINFNACCKCGSTHSIITLDPDIGGYICSSCYINEKIFDDKTIKMLRMYYLVDIDSITELKISPLVVKNLSYFIKTYYDRYTGLYLKSRDFIENINVQI